MRLDNISTYAVGDVGWIIETVPAAYIWKLDVNAVASAGI